MAKSKDLEKEKSEKPAEAANGKPAEKKQKKQDKNKKPNFFVRMGRKIKETFLELKRVTWPTLPQALKATGVVIVIVLIFLVVTTGINFGFSELLKLLTNLGVN